MGTLPVRTGSDSGTGSGTTTVSVTIDAGAGVGDLVVCLITTDTDGTITPPAGWKPMPAMGGNSGLPNMSAGMVFGFWRIYAGVDSYDFELSASAGFAWATEAWSGVHAKMPFSGCAPNEGNATGQFNWVNFPRRLYTNSVMLALAGFESAGAEAAGPWSAGTWVKQAFAQGSNRVADITSESVNYLTVAGHDYGTGRPHYNPAGTVTGYVLVYCLTPADGPSSTAPEVIGAHAYATGGGTTVSGPQDGYGSGNWVMPGMELIVSIVATNESANFTVDSPKNGDLGFAHLTGSPKDCAHDTLRTSLFHTTVDSDVLTASWDEVDIDYIRVTSDVSCEFSVALILVAHTEDGALQLTSPLFTDYNASSSWNSAGIEVQDNSLVLMGFGIPINYSVSGAPSGYASLLNAVATGNCRNHIHEKDVLAAGTEDPGAATISVATQGTTWLLGIAPPVVVPPTGGLGPVFLPAVIC